MLKRTPLHSLYAEHGARLVDFGGWDLPVQFAGIQAEHDAVRERVGLFDVSHMGEVIVAGADAEAFLQKLTVNDVAKLAAGQAQYSLMCYPDGGVVDDLLIYKLAPAQYLTVINASNIEKDLDWMRQHLAGDVRLQDVSDQTALLALQGPQAARVLAKVTEAPVAELGSFRFLQDVDVAGVKALVSRTGYTGEDGFELYVPGEHTAHLWRALIKAGEAEGLLPCGLGARDTLRFEAKLPLYGQELSAAINPLEAGVGFFVKWDKGDFIGRQALLRHKEDGLQRKLVGIIMVDRGIPRTHYPVFDATGRAIGEVTTGTQSPTLKQNVGLALLDAAHAALGTEVFVEIRGKRLKAQVVKTPFYKRGQGKEKSE